jgi:hypothetical protein
MRTIIPMTRRRVPKVFQNPLADEPEELVVSYLTKLTFQGIS